VRQLPGKNYSRGVVEAVPAMSAGLGSRVSMAHAASPRTSWRRTTSRPGDTVRSGPGQRRRRSSSWADSS